MGFYANIDKRFVDDRVNGILTVKGDAFFYFPSIKKNGTTYKPNYVLFTLKDYGSNWEDDPIDRKASSIEHKILITNNDAWVFSGRDAWIEFYQTLNTDNRLKEWFIRSESYCTVAYEGREFHRGNKKMLKDVGVELLL